MAQHRSKATLPKDFNYTAFKRELKRELVQKCGLDETVATRHVETLLEQTHEEILTRVLKCPRAEHRIQLAKEIGEINYERVQRGEKINFSKYNLTQEQQKIVEEACEQLRNSKGVLDEDGPLGRLIRTGVKGADGELHGPLYELEAGLVIKKEGEEIVGFGNQYKHETRNIGYNEFDIETPTKLIECKNIKWPDLANYKSLPEPEQKRIDDMMASFRNKNHIAKEVLKKELEVSSPEIPEAWKNFFNSLDIKFIERNLR